MRIYKNLLQQLFFAFSIFAFCCILRFSHIIKNIKKSFLLLLCNVIKLLTSLSHCVFNNYHIVSHEKVLRRANPLFQPFFSDDEDLSVTQLSSVSRIIGFLSEKKLLLLISPRILEFYVRKKIIVNGSDCKCTKITQIKMREY